MKETKHVRIIDNTFTDNSETKAMIGGIFEVKEIDYSDETFGVHTDKEKEEYLYFYFSDVQEVCLEAVVDGYVLGVGDMIENKPILGIYIFDGDICVRYGNKFDTSVHELSNILYKNITPLYKTTIKIGEKLYNKSEVDKALANLKEIK